ncbi:hypothetical protein DID88_000439 [Monilinia fructigena]|uniref:CCHC-type domain-containing protein n=1 Tax=Monilinia fructigena TaxID=38457 RepID=A0A395IHV8_9HELO|nr:hypothetical protein DID88_000439 [Monilinia fructigena]
MADQATASGLFPTVPFPEPYVLNSVETDVSSFTDLFNDPNAVHFAAAQAVFESIESITSSLQTQAAAAAEAQTADAQSKIIELKDTIEILKIAIRNSPQAPLRRKYLAAPEKFSGDEQDIAKRQDQYTAFRSAIHFDAITDNPYDSDLWPLGWRTVASIWRELNKQYQTLDLSRKASMDYDKCKMKKIPFGNFITEFKQLAIKCKKTAEQQVADLKLKVSQELIDASVNRPNKPSAADIDAWTIWWQGIYDDLEEKTHLDNQRKNQGTNFNRDQSKPHNRKQATAETPPTPDISSDPMQLDAARQGQRPLARYTREQCIDLGLCLYCKKAGHIKSNCEEKRANDAKYNANANTRYAPHINRFPAVSQYQSPGPHRNAATPSYQNSFPPANRFSATPLRYASPIPSSLAQEVDLGGYVEGSIHSESGSSIPQPGMLKD